ncbi:MAG: hypothetical protein RIQ46_954 [Pseudomonadota bacterium]|jgi:two-component system sensor kinase FixL
MATAFSVPRKTGRLMGGQDQTISRIFEVTHTVRARVLLEAMPSALVVIDERGIVQAIAKAALDMFGYAEEDVVGQNVAMLMPQRRAEQHDEYLRHYRQTGEKRIIGQPRIEAALHRSGHQFPIEISIGEAEIDGERCFLGFLRAINPGDQQRREMKRMLAELAHASRVSAMGALATAIAHELNQPLTTIANYTEGLRNMLAQHDELPRRDEYVRVLENCSRQAVRAGQLIHRLREFIRGGEPHVEAVSVEQMIDDSVALALINGYRRTVQFDYAIEDGLPRVATDPLQGQQVIFNLIRNAFDAVDAEHGDHHVIRITARRTDGGMVEVGVEDEGPGVDPELQETLFDSFVTTKASGMGVGLAICRQIIEAYGGTIWAGASEKLGGAAFRFTLPVHVAGATEDR